VKTACCVERKFTAAVGAHIPILYEFLPELAAIRENTVKRELSPEERQNRLPLLLHRRSGGERPAHPLVMFLITTMG
jgi:hypothetical protein